MAHPSSLFPKNPSLEEIEGAINFLDSTEKTYFEACEDAMQYTTAMSLGTIFITAKNHVRAYARSLAPLLYDAQLEEFGSISHTLMAEKELKRVTQLNSLLNSTVLKPILPTVHFPFADTASNPHANEVIDKKLDLYRISSSMFENHVSVDTELFVKQIA